jgi:hypothetical protein
MKSFFHLKSRDLVYKMSKMYDSGLLCYRTIARHPLLMRKAILRDLGHGLDAHMEVEGDGTVVVSSRNGRQELDATADLGEAKAEVPELNMPSVHHSTHASPVNDLLGLLQH